MPREIRYPEFIQSLEDTNYPFSLDVSLTNSEGTKVPKTAFLDAHLYPIGGAEGIYLSKVSVSYSAITFHIGDSSVIDLASGSIALPITGTASDLNGNDASSQTLCVRLLDAYERPAGILVSDKLRIAEFSGFGVGDHNFIQEQTEFVTTVCMPTPEIGVRGIVLPDGSVMSRNVWFVGEDGVVFRHSEKELPSQGAACSGNTAYSTIRVDAMGDPYFLRKLCFPVNLFSTPNFLKTLKVVNSQTASDGSEQSYEFDTTAADDTSKNGRVFIQGNDSLAAKAALRVRTSSDGTIEMYITGTPTQQSQVR